MKRPSIALCLLLAEVAYGGEPQKLSPAAPQDGTVRRPNIVVIMADDHGRQAVSCYGSKLIQTPNIVCFR